jgi:transcription initiation factor TFIIIB Brf1 subunit/transcription initiation factor TFIIB
MTIAQIVARSSVHIRREFKSHNTSVRPETAGPLRKETTMSLMTEDLSRDRMRRVQRDAELARAAHQRRLRKRQARSSVKNA